MNFTPYSEVVLPRIVNLQASCGLDLDGPPQA